MPPGYPRSTRLAGTPLDSVRPEFGIGSRPNLRRKIRYDSRASRGIFAIGNRSGWRDWPGTCFCVIKSPVANQLQHDLHTTNSLTID